MMIKKIGLAIVLGIGVLLYQLQHDAWINQLVTSYVVSLFRTSYQADFSGTLTDFSLVSPCCTFTTVTVHPIDDHKQDAWAWSADHITVSFSWMQFLWHRAVQMHIVIEECVAQSKKQGTEVPIFDHIALFFKSPSGVVPVFVKGVTFKSALLTIVQQDQLQASLRWHSETKNINNVCKTMAYIVDGTLVYAGIDYLDRISGIFGLETSLVNNTWQRNGYLKFVSVSDCIKDKTENCFFSGTWDVDRGICTFKTADQSCMMQIDDIVVTSRGGAATVQADLPVEYLLRALGRSDPITGSVFLKTSGTVHDGQMHTLHGTAELRNCCYNTLKLGKTVAVSFDKTMQISHGTVSLFGDAIKPVCSGTWQWDDTIGAGSCIIHPTFSESLCGWSVDTEKTNIAFQCNGLDDISGLYLLHATHKESDDAMLCTGAITVENDDIQIAGYVNDIAYKIKGDMKKYPYFVEGVCIDGNTIEQMHCTHSNNAEIPTWSGFVNVGFINRAVDYWLGYKTQSQGVVQFTALYDGSLTTQLHFVDAAIRVPQIYNYMNGLDGTITYNVADKAIEITDVHCSFDCGSVLCKRGVLQFDDAYGVAFAHLPVHLRECLLNVNKDLFAMVSAQLLCTKIKNDLPTVFGSLLIDRSQLKENIFSQLLQKDVLQYPSKAFSLSSTDVACALSIETVAPIRVQTPFLETNARVMLLVTNTVRNPHISGLVNLDSGILQFPYKPLHITKGSLLFSPSQPYDPFVTIEAKNKIKKHQVGLYVSGSVSNPHIMLESSPSLSEEQIVALLLVGSQEESLNIVMPALIMSNITNLIFGHKQSEDSLEGSFKRLLKPLGSIHLVPSFTDQTGRGGLRGALEIEVTDRLHALIQKNFSLSEDTRVEVEYLLSDDVSVRGIRDERRDVGGEVEMRWKF
ncbi:MAG TPA: translocation/assembly module TamB domain-containing protein [Candidatus Babeliales bacterium]|nr:translocation/assembly module TamB domain-containing protein [Candidatus Babeliales bacterium]